MAADGESKAKKKGGGGRMLVVGVVLALAFGGGGFYAVYSGAVGLPLPEKTEKAEEAHAPDAAAPPAPVAAFAPLDPILVSLGQGSGIRQLQMIAQLEIEPSAADHVADLGPRVRDVMATYLRAVNPADVQNPAALLRMRAQLLRRIQVVTGEGMVRDLLVSEFVLR